MTIPGSLHPATGEILSTVAYTSVEGLPEMIERGKAAQQQWVKNSFDDRAAVLTALGRAILQRRQEVLPLLEQELGRQSTESLVTEVVVALDYAKGAIRTARKALRQDRVRLSPPKLSKQIGSHQVCSTRCDRNYCPMGLPADAIFQTFIPSIYSQHYYRAM